MSGSQTSFSANPDDGLPIILGRTGTAGKISYRVGFDTRDAGDNDRQAFVSVLSVGPIAGIDYQTVEKVQTNYANGAAIGAYAGWMWSQTQLGRLSEPALGFGAGAGAPPGWTTQHRLSGLAAATWTLRFDTKGKQFQAGVPAPLWVARGRLCYDPTKDSTYPGGNGPHRMADPANAAAYDAATATWEWSEDPYLLGLMWAHGIWQRDIDNPASPYQRVAGIGAPWDMIDVPAFVEGRNIATANGWKAGGVVYTTDGKWDTMKRILQAGMGEPLPLGARISCLVNAPKVSLATITIDDVVGPAKVSATQARRDRLNTITPRYRLEENNWTELPGAPISVPEYVAFDRGKRSRLQDYPLIQNTPQVATAVRYDIENSREFGPIVLPLKLVWMGYKPGDCVTARLPELGLNDQPVLLLNRGLSPSNGVVTMTARSETAAKHPYALGQTTTPPPTPGVTGPLLVPTPRDGDWTLSALPARDELVTPTLAIRGATRANVDGVVFEYRVFDSGAVWTAAGSDAATVTYREITGLRAATLYEVAVSYMRNGVTGERRVLGPVETATVSVKGDPGEDGEPGEDGLDGFVIDVDQPFFAIPVFPGGAAKPSWVGGSGTIRLRKGDALVTAGVSYTIENVRNIAGAGLDGSHFSFAGITADTGSFIVAATYNGATYRAQVDAKKVYDGSAAFRGEVLIDQTGGFGSVTVPANRAVTLSASLIYYAGGNAPAAARCRMSLYWRNATDNGEWNFLGSVDGSSASKIDHGRPGEPEYEITAGEVSAAFGFTSPSPDKQIDYRAGMAVIFGQLDNAGISGTMALEVTG